MKCQILDPREVITRRCYTSAIVFGEMLKYGTGGALIPVAANTDDATFMGIAMGECEATVDSGNPIQVMVEGLIKVALSSATYAWGAGLLWVDNTLTLAADSNANTIAWIYDDNQDTRTSAIVYINVPLLGAVVGKQFDVVSA